ncbi:MAG: VOC family protein [Aquamicrobium sp.]|uniref:VOC family protein n=1 Tax=Aquamicrobium sp. TaxID=1872579 RepID=UPI00349E99D5|nr:VOC family protein [Aquamicrobium sp.]
MEPRISLVTLGVDDLDRAVAFYEAMGLERHERFTDGVAFFQMGGLILALWPREEMARDAGKAYSPRPVRAVAVERRGERGFVERVLPGFSGVALAYNTRSEEEVAEVLAMVKAAGGRVLKPAARAVWGGMQGYFEDSEGNLWEVAHNPGFPIDEEGRISLPE